MSAVQITVILAHRRTHPSWKGANTKQPVIRNLFISTFQPKHINSIHTYINWWEHSILCCIHTYAEKTTELREGTSTNGQFHCAYVYTEIDVSTLGKVTVGRSSGAHAAHRTVYTSADLKCDPSKWSMMSSNGIFVAQIEYMATAARWLLEWAKKAQHPTFASPNLMEYCSVCSALPYPGWLTCTDKLMPTECLHWCKWGSAVIQLD